MEGDVVKAVFLNAKVDDLAGIVIPPVEVVLCKRGLEGIYGGALSEEDVHVLMSQTNFVCIEGETILYVLLKLNGRSDEIVIHALAPIGIEVGVVCTIAKKVGTLACLGVGPTDAVSIIVDDGEEVEVFLRIELLYVIRNPNVARNDLVGGHSHIVCGRFAHI